jgi:tRNA threonylcarbamoyladenosine modification (KEOPS) complex  Pcc1 subunit
VKDYIDREGPRRNTTIIIVKTTLEQDNAIERSMREQSRDKPQLESGVKITLQDNCSTRVVEALDAAGINSGGFEPPLANVPGSAVFERKAPDWKSIESMCHKDQTLTV